MNIRVSESVALDVCICIARMDELPGSLYRKHALIELLDAMIPLPLRNEIIDYSTVRDAPATPSHAEDPLRLSWNVHESQSGRQPA